MSSQTRLCKCNTGETPGETLIQGAYYRISRAICGYRCQVCIMLPMIPALTRIHGTCGVQILVAAVIAALLCHAQVMAADQVLRLAITTSFRDSGLADHLLPEFEKQNNARVHMVAVGSGMALEIARRGDVDVLVAHAPEEELRFMAQGWGNLREPIMYNYFLLLGSGPQQPDVVSALRYVAANSMTFVSRGDDSGTHKKEVSLWQQAGISPQGNGWYLSVGQGMAATLRLADQKKAVVLSDSGTWLALKDGLQLGVMVRDDELLKNTYHIIVVNPEKHAHANHEGALQFLRYITSKSGQDMISSYRVAGQQAFYAINE